MMGTKAKPQDGCEVCEHRRPTTTIETKGHGRLAVCRSCAEWATRYGYTVKQAGTPDAA